MRKVRIIARIDIKNEFAIKGIQFEGLRKVGNPNELAKRYYEAGIDEIIYMDAVASYYERNSLQDVVASTCENIFVPITVGGGIRTVEDIQQMLLAGADKVAINSQAIKTPDFIQKAAQIYGSQCIVGSVEAKKVAEGRWEAYIENGREPTGIDVVEWVKKLECLGAGEILLTSVDKDGTKKGCDLELIDSIQKTCSLPLIVAGGVGKLADTRDAAQYSGVDAICVASMLHYGMESIDNIKKEIAQIDNVEVRC
ncbi:imidazole glycerol phosphate synthase subunit HisF [Alteromonas sediminis]|uniref:imidazole glycerol-phosphate synthase n=1 Tax=Alteromonas sediminis TaxID=2259342 RepID=A0A3N5Y905_9ALTE|nr:imidazole glycerol phosphate synthase cyclase subunit [Alteromonas sediminis]RPJ64985.1 imidazole glycerol phosphate synthase subunit HisF [Alteromonas sediminis]